MFKMTTCTSSAAEQWKDVVLASFSLVTAGDEEVRSKFSDFLKHLEDLSKLPSESNWIPLEVKSLMESMVGEREGMIEQSLA